MDERRRLHMAFIWGEKGEEEGAGTMKTEHGLDWGGYVMVGLLSRHEVMLGMLMIHWDVHRDNLSSHLSPYNDGILCWAKRSGRLLPIKSNNPPIPTSMFLLNLF